MLIPRFEISTVVRREVAVGDELWRPGCRRERQHQHSERCRAARQRGCSYRKPGADVGARVLLSGGS